jgi:hypothetical protein
MDLFKGFPVHFQSLAGLILIRVADFIFEVPGMKAYLDIRPDKRENFFRQQFQSVRVRGILYRVGLASGPLKPGQWVLITGCKGQGYRLCMIFRHKSYSFYTAGMPFVKQVNKKILINQETKISLINNIDG